MFQRFLAIARNTTLETIRQPIYSVILLATALLLVLNVALAAFTLEDDNKLLLDLGLSTLLLSGLFLSVFSAAGVLSREIDNKTVLTLISKPVGRPTLIMGKFAGLLAALMIAFYLSALVFILTVRHGVLQRSSDPWDAPVLALGCGAVGLALLTAAFANYFYDKDFATTLLLLLTPLLTAAVLLVGKFDEHWDPIPFGSNYVGGQILIAVYLVALCVIVTSAVALAASTRFGQLMTLIICTCVLGLGVISDYAFGQYSDQSRLAALVYQFVPNIGPFWIIDGLQANSERTTVTGHYVLLATAYASCLTAAVLAIGIAAFEQREVG